MFLFDGGMPLYVCVCVTVKVGIYRDIIIKTQIILFTLHIIHFGMLNVCMYTSL